MEPQGLQVNRSSVFGFQNLNRSNNIHNRFHTTMIRCTIFYNYPWNPITFSHCC